MENVWSLQEAKNRFSLVIERALKFGAQVVTRRGRPVAVILSKETYERLTHPREDLATFLRRSPLLGLDLETEREASPHRDAGLKP